MEAVVSGEVFAKRERDYTADPGGKWPAGTSRVAVLLDFGTREVREVKFKGAEGEIAYARVSLDEHVDLVCDVRPNGQRLDLVFKGYAPVAPAAVKVDKPA